jgi:hypothetical protein
MTQTAPTPRARTDAQGTATRTAQTQGGQAPAQDSGLSLFGWRIPTPDLNIIPDDFDPLNPRDYIPDVVENAVSDAYNGTRRTLRDAWRAVNPYFDSVTNAMSDFATEVAGRFRYRMGAKGEGGFIDCSGFIQMAVRNVTQELVDNNVISAGTATRIRGIFNNNSEGQITAMARYGTMLNEDQLRANGLCEGMVLAIDTGQHRHDAGRALGIDHIAYCFRGEDGRLMIAESRSGAGTTVSEAQGWFERYAARGTVMGVRMDEVINTMAGGQSLRM